LSGGFPHSDIPGSKGALASPGLIAECHVLHRLLLPRHPPNALLALDPIQKKTGPFAEESHVVLPRFALLEDVVQPQPVSMLWTEVIDPDASPRQAARRLRPSTIPKDQRGSRSVSLDLERLSLVSYRALRCLRTFILAQCQTQDAALPHSGTPQKRLVYCSLHDVSLPDVAIRRVSRLSRSSIGQEGSPSVSLPIGSLSCSGLPLRCLRPSRGLVGREGVEPSTSRLSGVRSNHLSYRPQSTGARARLPQGCWWSPSPGGLAPPKTEVRRNHEVVEPTGIEPVTSCLQSTRSPS
jgi:hypothetical protein